MDGTSAASDGDTTDTVDRGDAADTGPAGADDGLLGLDGDIAAGVRDVSPLMLGIVPFALVAGIAAVDAGLRLA